MATRIIFKSFHPTPEQVKMLSFGYNGAPLSLQRLLRIVTGSHISEVEVRKTLHGVVEDALIATFIALYPDDCGFRYRFEIHPQQELFLIQAFARRIPGNLNTGEKNLLAQSLLSELKRMLSVSDGQLAELLIDDGRVSMENGRIVAYRDALIPH